MLGTYLIDIVFEGGCDDPKDVLKHICNRIIE